MQVFVLTKNKSLGELCHSNVPLFEVFNTNDIFLQVPGNFHVSTHSSRKQPESVDMSHFLHELSFGAGHDNGKVSNLK